MTDALPHAEVVQALERLEAALGRNAARSATMLARAADLRNALLAGTPLDEAVSQEQRPLIVELITENIQELQAAGVELRRTEAAGLRREGLPIHAIATLFGVTRQRVSALLRDR